MKKLSTLILGCALTLVLSACQKPMHSSENNPSSAIAPGESSGTTSTPQDTSETKEPTFSVVFLNYDNTLLYEATGIKRGKPAIYGGLTPTRPDTDEYKYEFIGWDKNLTAIYSDLAVVAQYTAVSKKEVEVPNEPSVFKAYEAVPNENGMNLAFAGIYNDQYYAYYFDLGVVDTTPIYSSQGIKYMNQDYDVKFKFQVCTIESLTREMTTAAQAIHTESGEANFKYCPEVTLFDFVSLKTASIDAHFLSEDTTTITNTQKYESSYTTTYTEENEFKIRFSEENGFRRKCTYRLSFFETVRCYGVLIYDIDKEEYSYRYETLLDSNDQVMILEETSDERGRFVYDINSNLEFDLDTAIEIAKREEPRFDKRVRLENQNGTNSIVTIYLDNEGNYRGVKPAIPTLANKVFLGYFSKKELGQGDCYLDANMNVVKPIDQNITLFAHWSDPSHSVTNHENGADNTYKSKGNDEGDWNGLWKGESKAFASGFKTSEVADAIKGGYKYVQARIKMDVYEQTDGWEWMAFRTRKNDVFNGDIQVFKISVASKSWKSVIFNFTFDARFLTDSSITYQLEYGVSGNGNNEWKRGNTVTDLTLVKEAIAPYAENIVEGGPYSL